MLKKLFIILSLMTTIIIILGCKLYTMFDFYIFIVLAILIFLGLNIAYFLLYIIFLWILSLTINTKKEYDKPNKFYQRLTTLTMEMLTNYARINLTVKGKELVPHNQKYMFVFNHCSNFDPIIQSYIFRNDNLVHISKPENFKVPIAGAFIKRCGYLSVDRENTKNGLKTIIKAIKLIESDIASVGVSPEGTRNRKDGLLPFRSGCFKIALKAKCPIVVCTMRNTRNIHKNFPFKSTNVEMRIIKVLTYEEIKDLNTNEISQLVRKLMCEDLNILDFEEINEDINIENYEQLA